MTISNYSFYNSIDLFIDGKQVIVYPDRDAVGSYKGFQQQDLERHVRKLIKSDPKYFADMNYAISFIWNFEGKRMLDMWKFNGNFVDDRSGPLADVRVYKDMNIERELGAASGNTLLVLGYEEKLRRESHDLATYLKGSAPVLPFGLQLPEDFFNFAV